jgi:hypothetical protein
MIARIVFSVAKPPADINADLPTPFPTTRLRARSHAAGYGEFIAGRAAQRIASGLCATA